jgi:hypothetical protein
MSSLSAVSTTTAAKPANRDTSARPCTRRLRRHLAQTVELLLGDLLRFLRHAGRFDPLAELVDLLLAVVVLAQLLLDRLHLLAQVVLALGLADLVGDLRLDLARDLLQLDLARDDLDQLLDAVPDVVALERPIFSSTAMLSTDAARSRQARGVARPADSTISPSRSRCSAILNHFWNWLIRLRTRRRDRHRVQGALRGRSRTF